MIYIIQCQRLHRHMCPSGMQLPNYNCIVEYATYEHHTTLPWTLPDEQFPASPIHLLSRQVRNQFWFVSLHRRKTWSPFLLTQIFPIGSKSGHPAAENVIIMFSIMIMLITLSTILDEVQYNIQYNMLNTFSANVLHPFYF